EGAAAARLVAEPSAGGHRTAPGPRSGAGDDRGEGNCRSEQLPVTARDRRRRDARPRAMAREGAAAARVEPTPRSAGSFLGRLEGRHRSVGGNALRAAVLGANDGLCSNLSLVMGVAGASIGLRQFDVGADAARYVERFFQVTTKIETYPETREVLDGL